MSKREAAPLEIPVDHPAFEGHFPGMPIVPGVVLLDEALFAIATATRVPPAHIAWAKFLRAVPPGQTLTIAHQQEPGGAVLFEITAGTERVAAGSLLPAPAP